MGLYPIDCPACGKTFQWFSGCLDTRCPDCIKANPIVVTADLKACGHKPCMLKGCNGCVQHCANAIKLVWKDEQDATQEKRKGDTK